MKKIILAFAVFCFLFSACLAQPLIKWQKCYGGSDFENANSIIETDDGGFLFAGWSKSNDGDVSGNHGGEDFWVAKISNNGTIQWQNSYGGTDHEVAFSAIQTYDGNYAIAGYTGSNDGDISTTHGGIDYWLVKLDTSGNIIWEKCFGGTYQEEAYSLIETSDSGFALAGMTFSNDGDVNGNHGNYDYWIIKLDSSATLKWQTCLGGTGVDMAKSIVQTSDGGFAVTGHSGSIDGNVSNNHGWTDFWIAKLDTNGGLQWQNSYGGSDYEWSYGIIEKNNGNIVACGYTQSSDGDVVGSHGSYDAWIVELTGNGNFVRQKPFGGTSADEFISLFSTGAENGFLATGISESNNYDVSGNHGMADIWIAETDSNLNISWQKSIGGDTTEYSFSIIQTSQNDYTIAGRTGSNDGDVGFHPLKNDIWVVNLTNNLNKITGKLFADLNGNQIQDSGENFIINSEVNETNTSGIAFSGQNGLYELTVFDSGYYDVSPESLNYYNAVPAIQNVYFSGINQTDSLNDFAFQPTGVFNDLCVTITPMGNCRADMNANYIINYENVGTTTLNGTVIFFPGNDVTYVLSNPIATSVTTDSVVWNVGTLTPFQTGNILLTVHVNAGTPIGTLINSNVVIEPVTGDANTACNYNAYEVFVTGAVDPNAILVDRDTVFTPDLSSPPYLNYIIYFQNTGNDTAFNARVLNNISQMLDVNSFEFVASSHPVNITYGAHARLMEFTFDTILLPDSNVNEPASHGFIRYRIKPLSTLVAGDSIKNNAAIYFDFNLPVMTNTAVTEIVLPTNLTPGPSPKERGVALAPNPATNTLTIKFPQLTTDHCQLITYDLFGREVYKSEINNPKSEIRIDVSGLAKGIYLIEINSAGKIYRAKFVKE